ncbi:methylenetetrahydrofolate reductase [Pseudodesulfovibrio sediminis]|uniref:Methylenetetrahydrofolate reductase n=1 Tax=Pseudodesulfovibrio sediminis TaxID=2810563 RepID=A0ABN6EXC4_9BACT|nr:methylenetetrahydrofolate reductase [Pseudodesulfovibrio sediminis]BCS89834.1 methylenetetrahydrofolate reductase [Pseudodesulfovibrio sediminis]
MKISDLIPRSDRFLSLEFFPPKGQEGWPQFFDQVNQLAGLDPLFVSITYGAGGKLQDNTLEIASAVNERFGLTTMSHLTCVGAERDSIARYLDHLLDAGINNVLALRGDLPTDYPGDAWKDFAYASDLVEFVREGWPEICAGTACYPDAHPESGSIEDDLKWTCHKFEAGSDFAITQLFFDVRRYQDIVTRLRNRGITKPIVPGVLPVLSLQSLNRILALCGANIPLKLYLELQKAHEQGGDMAVREKGVEIARRQIRELLAMGAPGIHLYTLNNADLCLDILTDLPELDG